MKTISLALTLGFTLVNLVKGAESSSPTLKWTNRPTGPWTCPRVGKAENVFPADNILQMIAADTYLWGRNQTENWSGLTFPEAIPEKTIKGYHAKDFPQICTRESVLRAYPIMIVEDDTDTSKPGPYRVIISSAHDTKKTADGEVHEYAFCGVVAKVEDPKHPYKVCSPKAQDVKHQGGKL